MGNNLAKRFMSLMLASVTLFSNIGVEKVFSTPAFASENKKREKRSSEGDVPEINFTFQSQQGGESLLNLQNFNMNSSTEVDPDNKGGVYLINANNDFYVNLQMEGSMTSGEIESPIMRVKLPYFYENAEGNIVATYDKKHGTEMGLEARVTAYNSFEYYDKVENADDEDEEEIEETEETTEENTEEASSSNLGENTEKPKKKKEKEKEKKTASSWFRGNELKVKMKRGGTLKAGTPQVIQVQIRFFGDVPNNIGGTVLLGGSYENYREPNGNVIEANWKSDPGSQEKARNTYVSSQLLWNTKIEAVKTPVIWDRYNYVTYKVTVENNSKKNNTDINGYVINILTNDEVTKKYGILNKDILAWKYNDDGSVEKNDNFSVGETNTKFIGIPEKGGVLVYDVTDVNKNVLNEINWDDFNNLPIEFKSIPYVYSVNGNIAINIDEKLVADKNKGEGEYSKKTYYISVPYPITMQNPLNTDYKLITTIKFGKNNEFTWSKASDKMNAKFQEPRNEFNFIKTVNEEKVGIGSKQSYFLKNIGIVGNVNTYDAAIFDELPEGFDLDNISINFNGRGYVKKYTEVLSNKKYDTDMVEYYKDEITPITFLGRTEDSENVDLNMFKPENDYEDGVVDRTVNGVKYVIYHSDVTPKYTDYFKNDTISFKFNGEFVSLGLLSASDPENGFQYTFKLGDLKKLIKDYEDANHVKFENQIRLNLAEKLKPNDYNLTVKIDGTVTKLGSIKNKAYATYNTKEFELYSDEYPEGRYVDTEKRTDDKFAILDGNGGKAETNITVYNLVNGKEVITKESLSSSDRYDTLYKVHYYDPETYIKVDVLNTGKGYMYGSELNVRGFNKQESTGQKREDNFYMEKILIRKTLLNNDIKNLKEISFSKEILNLNNIQEDGDFYVLPVNRNEITSVTFKFNKILETKDSKDFYILFKGRKGTLNGRIYLEAENSVSYPEKDKSSSDSKRVAIDNFPSEYTMKASSKNSEKEVTTTDKNTKILESVNLFEDFSYNVNIKNNNDKSFLGKTVLDINLPSYSYLNGKLIHNFKGKTLTLNSQNNIEVEKVELYEAKENGKINETPIKTFNGNNNSFDISNYNVKLIKVYYKNYKGLVSDDKGINVSISGAIERNSEDNIFKTNFKLTQIPDSGDNVSKEIETGVKAKDLNLFANVNVKYNNEEYKKIAIPYDRDYSYVYGVYSKDNAIISYPEVTANLPIRTEGNDVVGFHTTKIAINKEGLDSFRKVSNVKIVYFDKTEDNLEYSNGNLSLNGTAITLKDGNFILNESNLKNKNISKIVISGEFLRKNINSLVEISGYSDTIPGNPDNLEVVARNYLLDPNVAENKDINYIYDNKEIAERDSAKIYVDTTIKASFVSRNGKTVWSTSKEDARKGLRSVRYEREGIFYSDSDYVLDYWNDYKKGIIVENPELEIGYKSIGTYSVNFRQFLNTGNNFPRLYDEKFVGLKNNTYSNQDTNDESIKDFSLNTKMDANLDINLPLDKFDAYYMTIDKKIIPYVNFIEITKKDGNKVKILGNDLTVNSNDGKSARINLLKINSSNNLNDYYKEAFSNNVIPTNNIEKITVNVSMNKNKYESASSSNLALPDFGTWVNDIDDNSQKMIDITGRFFKTGEAEANVNTSITIGSDRSKKRTETTTKNNTKTDWGYRNYINAYFFNRDSFPRRDEYYRYGFRNQDVDYKAGDLYSSAIVYVDNYSKQNVQKGVHSDVTKKEDSNVLYSGLYSFTTDFEKKPVNREDFENRYPNDAYYIPKSWGYNANLDIIKNAYASGKHTLRTFDLNNFDFDNDTEFSDSVKFTDNLPKIVPDSVEKYKGFLTKEIKIKEELINKVKDKKIHYTVWNASSNTKEEKEFSIDNLRKDNGYFVLKINYKELGASQKSGSILLENGTFITSYYFIVNNLNGSVDNASEYSNTENEENLSNIKNAVIVSGNVYIVSGETKKEDAKNTFEMKEIQNDNSSIEGNDSAALYGYKIKKSLNYGIYGIGDKDNFDYKDDFVTPTPIEFGVKLQNTDKYSQDFVELKPNQNGEKVETKVTKELDPAALDSISGRVSFSPFQRINEIKIPKFLINGNWFNVESINVETKNNGNETFNLEKLKGMIKGSGINVSSYSNINEINGNYVREDKDNYYFNILKYFTDKNKLENREEDGKTYSFLNLDYIDFKFSSSEFKNLQDGKIEISKSNSLLTNEYLTIDRKDGYTISFVGDVVDRTKENSKTFVNDLTSNPSAGKSQLIHEGYDDTFWHTYYSRYNDFLIDDRDGRRILVSYNGIEERYGKIFNNNFYFTKNEETYKDLKYMRLFDVSTAHISNIDVISPNVNAKPFSDGNTQLKDSLNVYNRSSMVDVSVVEDETEINGQNFKIYYIDKNGNKVGKSLDKIQGGDYIEKTITVKNRDKSTSYVDNFKINIEPNNLVKVVSYEILENNNNLEIVGESDNQKVSSSNINRLNNLILNVKRINVGDEFKVKIVEQVENNENKENIEDLINSDRIYFYGDKLHSFNNIKFLPDETFHYNRQNHRDNLFGKITYDWNELFDENDNGYYSLTFIEDNKLNNLSEDNIADIVYTSDRKNQYIYGANENDHAVLNFFYKTKNYKADKPNISYTFDKEVASGNNLHHGTNDDATLTISNIKNETGRYIDELSVTTSFEDENGLMGFKLTEAVNPEYPNSGINHKPAKVEYFVNNEWKETVSNYTNVSKVRVTYFDITKDETEIPNIVIHGKGRWQDIRNTQEKQERMMNDLYNSTTRVDIKYHFVDDKNNSFSLDTFATVEKKIMRNQAKILIQNQVFGTKEDADANYDASKEQKLGYRPGDTLYNKIYVKNLSAEIETEKDGPLSHPVIYVKVPEYFENYQNINNFEVRKILTDGTTKVLEEGLNKDYVIEKENYVEKDFGGDQVINQTFDNIRRRNYANFSDIEIKKAYDTNYTFYKIKFKDDLDVEEAYDVVYSAKTRINGLPMTYKEKDGKIYNAYFPKLFEYGHTTYSHHYIDFDLGYPYIGTIYGYNKEKEYVLYNGKGTSFDKNYIENKNAMMDLDNLMLDAGVTGDVSAEEENWEFLNHSESYIPGSENGVGYERDVKNYYHFNRYMGVNERLDDYDINSGKEYSAQKVNYIISNKNRESRSWNNIYYSNVRDEYNRDYYSLLLKKRYENSGINAINKNIVWSTTKTRLQKAWILGSTDIQPLEKEQSDTANYKYIYGYGDYQKFILSNDFGNYDWDSENSYKNELNRNDKAIFLDDRFTALQYNQKVKHSLMAVNYGDWHLNGLTMTYVLPNGFIPDFNKGFTAKILSSDGENTYDGFNEDITNDVTMEVIQRPEDAQVYKALKTSASPQFNETRTPEYYNDKGTYVLKFTVNHKLNKWFNRGNEFGYKVLIEFESLVKDSNDNETWNDELIVTPKKDNDSLYSQILDIDQREGTSLTLQNTEPFMNTILDYNSGDLFAIGKSVNTPYINGINIENSKFSNNNSNGIISNTDEHELNKNIANNNLFAVTGTTVYMRKPNVNTWVTLNNSSDGKFKANDYKTYYINKIGESTKVNVHIQNKFNLENVLSNYSMTKAAILTGRSTYFENDTEKNNIGSKEVPSNGDYEDRKYKINQKFRYNVGTIGGNEGDYVSPVVNVILPTSLYPIKKDGKAVKENGENIISWKLYDKDGNLLANEQNKYNTKVTILNVPKENSTETEKKYLVQIYAKKESLGNPEEEARIKYNNEYVFSIDTVSNNTNQIDDVDGKEFASPISVFATSSMKNFKFVTDDDVISLMDKRKEEMSHQINLSSDIFEEDTNGFYDFMKSEIGDMYRIGGTWHNAWAEMDNSKDTEHAKEKYSRINPDDYHETMYKDEYLIKYKARDIFGSLITKSEKEEGGNLKKLDEAGNHNNVYKLIEYNHRYNEKDKFNLENSGNYNLYLSNYDFSNNGNTNDGGVFTQFNPRIKYPLLKLDIFVSDNLNEIATEKTKFEYGNKVYFSSKMKIEQENENEYGQYGNMYFRKLEETIAIPYSLNFNDKKEIFISYNENGQLVTKSLQELKDLGWQIEESRNTIEQDPIDSRKKYNIITYSILIPEKDFDTTNEETIMDSFKNGHPMGYLKNGDYIYFRIGTRVGNILEENFKSNKEDSFFESETLVGMLTTSLIKENWMKNNSYNIVYHNKVREDGSTWFKNGVSVPDVNKNGNTKDLFTRAESNGIQIKKPNADVRIDTGKPRVRLNNKDAEKALIDDPYMKSIQTMDMFITNAENKTNVNEFIVNVDVPKYATQYRSTRYADKSDYLMNSVIHSVRTGKWKFNNDYQNEAENYRVIIKARVSNDTENDFRGNITSNSNIDNYITIGNKDGYKLDENAEVLIPNEYERKITNVDFVITRKDNAPLTSDSNLRKENPVYRGLTLDVDALDDVTEEEYLKNKRKEIIYSLKYLKEIQSNVDLSDNGVSLLTKSELDEKMSGFISGDHISTAIIDSIFTQSEINELLTRTNLTKAQLNYAASNITLTEDEKNYVRSTVGIQNINDIDPNKDNLKELSKSIQENAPKINVSQEIINGTNSRKHLNYFATIWAKYDDNKFGSISDTERAGFYVNPQLPYLSTTYQVQIGFSWLMFPSFSNLLLITLFLYSVL